jgi:hypothetical protein
VPLPGAARRLDFADERGTEEGEGLVAPPAKRARVAVKAHRVAVNPCEVPRRWVRGWLSSTCLAPGPLQWPSTPTASFVTALLCSWLRGCAPHGPRTPQQPRSPQPLPVAVPGTPGPQRHTVIALPMSRTCLLHPHRSALRARHRPLRRCDEHQRLSSLPVQPTTAAAPPRAALPNWRHAARAAGPGGNGWPGQLEQRRAAAACCAGVGLWGPSGGIRAGSGGSGGGGGGRPAGGAAAARDARGERRGGRCAGGASPNARLTPGRANGIAAG